VKLSVPNVTLCCVDTRYPELAEFSLQRSVERAGIEFGDVVLLTSAERRNFSRRHTFAMRIAEIGEIRSKEDYSRFVIHDLAQHITTSHVLLTQWDSWVIDAAAWDLRFLDVDYIGAVWSWLDAPRVGNGGFSLRSVRLMRAAAAIAGASDENEDTLICRGLRPRLEADGMRFADEALAQRFAFERGESGGPVFGFHGLFNFHRVLKGDELAAYVERLPVPMIQVIEGAELALNLYNQGARDLGRNLVRRRLAADPADVQGLDLARRMWDPDESCWCGSAREFKSCHGAQPRAAAKSDAIGQTPAHDGYNVNVLQLLPPAMPRIVEVGSSSGALAAAYRSFNPACEYVGIEIDAEYAVRSAQRCSRVLTGNIENMPDEQLRELLPVDCWVFADVLEHLYDPWRLLRRLRGLMRPQDCIVACIPNAQHWSVIARLTSGQFWYEDIGLMDRTHIRFFTRLTLIKLFEEAGFRIQTGVPRIFKFQDEERVHGALRQFATGLGLDPDEVLRDANVFQYVVRAYPA